MAPGTRRLADRAWVAWQWPEAAEEGQEAEPTFLLAGGVQIRGGTFDLDELVGLSEGHPEIEACSGDGGASATRFGLGYLVGTHGNVDTTPQGAGFPDAVEAIAEDVLGVYASEAVGPESPSWGVFETALPSGVSLMRRTACQVEGTWCKRDRGICLQPLEDGAVVVLRPY